MPADTITVSLTGPLADNVRAAADAAGLTPEEYVRQEMAESVAIAAAADDDLSWDEDLRRLEEPGDNIPAEEVFAEIRARLAARIPAKQK